MEFFYVYGFIMLVSSIGAIERNLGSICNYKAEILNCSSQQLNDVPNFETKDATRVFSLLLNNNLLKHLRAFPSLAIVELSLAHNLISSIDSSAFRNLTNLKSLDLSYNQIKTDNLQPNIFMGSYAPEAYEPLRKLEKLNLAGNPLDSLLVNVFEHLPNLKVLNLGSVAGIDKNTMTAIAKAPALEELILSDIKLSTLPHSEHHMTATLQLLDLSHNLFTDVPIELKNYAGLRVLILDGNPIHKLNKPLGINQLETISLNYMPELTEIGNFVFGSAVREFYCSYNTKLLSISADAFRTIENDINKYSPVVKLVLRNNLLKYLDKHLVNNWKMLQMIDIQYNPWVCDCNNQWMISDLIEVIRKINSTTLVSTQCAEPSEMSGIKLVDLYEKNYEMRCLDLFDHKPEADGTLLLQILVITLVTIPIVMVLVMLYKRKTGFHYQRANNTDMITMRRYFSTDSEE